MNDERELIRAALMSDAAPSDELKSRFDDQVATVMRRRLRPWEKWLRGCVALCFVASAVFQACCGILFLIRKGPGISGEARLAVGGLLFLGAAVLLFGAGTLVYEISRGRVAPRKMQKAIVGLAMLPVLILSIFALVYVPTMDLPIDRLIYIFGSINFFWIMAQANIILARADWNRQDIILEQKRTQLQVALLREDLAGKRGL